MPERPRPAPRTDAGRAARWHSALPLLKVTHSAIARGSHAQQDGAEPVFPLADGAAGVRPNRGAELLLSGVPPEPRVRGLILGGAGQAGPWKGYLVSAWVPDPLDPRPESGWGCHAGFGAGKRLVTQPRPVKCVGLSPSPHRRRPQRCCFSATALAAPCPHGAFVLFWLFAAGHSLPPPPASPWHPARSRLPGSFLGVPRGSLLGSLGSARVPRPLGPLRQPPLIPVPARVLSPSAGVASWPGRGARRGRFFRSGLCARCCRRRGRLCSAEPSPERGLQTRGTTRLLAVGVGNPGRPGPWRRLAHGGRAAPSRRRRSSCWNRCAGWTRPASEPAGTTSMGSCAA